jgi:hypothetical protein
MRYVWPGVNSRKTTKPLALARVKTGTDLPLLNMMPVPGRAVTVMTRGALAIALIAAAGSTETDFTGLVASIALLLAMTRGG